MAPELKEKIRNHLRQQYSGIWNERQIEEHLENHVGFDQALYWIQRVSFWVPHGSKILDIGSGYGSFVISAAKRGFDATGIEVEEFEHRVSVERAQQDGLSPRLFLHGSALRLPFEDKSFDAVTLWNVIEHIPDSEKALDEIFRVLKTGGRLFLIAPNYAAFRREAHYHLPWFPFFPKKVARIYLKFLQKDSRFLDENIHYVTHCGIRRSLRKRQFSVSDDLLARLRSGFVPGRPAIAKIVDGLRRFHLQWLVEAAVWMKSLNPLQSSIDLVAKKID